MEDTRLTRIKKEHIPHAREWTMLQQAVYEIEHDGVILDLGTALQRYKRMFPENLYVVKLSTHK